MTSPLFLKKMSTEVYCKNNQFYNKRYLFYIKFRCIKRCTHPIPFCNGSIQEIKLLLLILNLNFMIVNMIITRDLHGCCEINWDMCKLTWISMLIIIKNIFFFSWCWLGVMNGTKNPRDIEQETRYQSRHEINHINK
jgi:hypothetical protein